METGSLLDLRDWIFKRMATALLTGDWIVVIKDFKKSKKRDERTNLGFADFKTRTLYLNVKNAGPRILIHELCHALFQKLLEKEASHISRAQLKKLKGRSRADKVFRWAELRTLEWEKIFFKSLDEEQKQILQMFIDNARKRS